MEPYEDFGETTKREISRGETEEEKEEDDEEVLKYALSNIFSERTLG